MVNYTYCYRGYAIRIFWAERKSILLGYILYRHWFADRHMMWTCAAWDYFYGTDQVEKEIFYDTYFDWKYYKELLIKGHGVEVKESLNCWWKNVILCTGVHKFFLLPISVSQKGIRCLICGESCYVQLGWKMIKSFTTI